MSLLDNSSILITGGTGSLGKALVKELLENSLDANSSKIKVIIKNAGKNLIQVIDDGDGMTIKDMHSSFVKHATSKINSIEDVFSISGRGTVVTGRVESGIIKVGEEIEIVHIFRGLVVLII